MSDRRFNGVLIALNRATGKIVYRHQLPTSANAPIAVFGNTMLVPARGPTPLELAKAATRRSSRTRSGEPERT